MWLLRPGKRNRWLTEKLERLIDAPLAEGDLTPDEEDDGVLSLYAVSTDEGRFVGAAFVLIFLTSLPQDFLLLPVECFEPLEPYADPIESLPAVFKSRHWAVRGLENLSNRRALSDRARKHPDFHVERIAQSLFFDLARDVWEQEHEIPPLTQKKWVEKLQSRGIKAPEK
jgi:hypothetical protein